MESTRSISKLTCPRCGSDWVCRSWRSGIIEQRVLRAMQISPYRCDTCDYRFYRRSVRHREARASKAGQAVLTQ